MPAKKRRNFFYLPLTGVGVAFVVTAFAYGVMAFQAVKSSGKPTDASLAHPLYQWLRVHGGAAMLVELAILAALTFGAIATDLWWNREGERFRRTNP